MEGINKVRIVLQQASRKMVNRWREVTFAGIVRIPFPVAAPASRERSVHTVFDIHLLRNYSKPERTFEPSSF